MSNPLLFHRRLLWSIIHANPSSQSSVGSQRLRSCPFTTATTKPSPNSSVSPSISFGSRETDILIEQLAKQDSDSYPNNADPSISENEPAQQTEDTTKVRRSRKSPTSDEEDITATLLGLRLESQQLDRDSQHVMTSNNKVQRRPKKDVQAKSSRSKKSAESSKTQRTNKGYPRTAAQAEPFASVTDPTSESPNDDIPFDHSYSRALTDQDQQLLPTRPRSQPPPPPPPPPSSSSSPTPRRRFNTATMEPWQIQKAALQAKFSAGGEGTNNSNSRHGGGWNPRKKLSPDAQDGIRNLHSQDPIRYSTPLLAEQFRVSPEAIRRILKSKWASQQPPEKMVERRERWAKRHDRIWDQRAQLGLRPRRMRDMRPETPEMFEEDLRATQILEEAARNA